MVKFGTGGWRAVIGEDFIKSNIKSVAQGLCDYAKKYNKTEKPIYIGYDKRFLSKNAAEWVAETIAQNNIDVFITNTDVPTPLIMFMTQKNNNHFGIEITASHNPYTYNGIKIFTEEGRDASVEFTNELEHFIEKSIPIDCNFNSLVESGKIKYFANAIEQYTDDIVSKVNPIKCKNFKILINPMYGSSTDSLIKILDKFGFRYDFVNSNRDAFFGFKLPAPNEETLEDFRNLVSTGKYDIGFALDGDGDRLGIIDKTGKYITSNSILSMLYYYLHEYRHWKGPVVKNLATTNMLDVIATELNEKCYEVPVGFKYISSKITETDAVLGGESSGGLTVRGHINGKDSVFAVALFLEMVSVLDMTPCEIEKLLEEKYGKFEMVEYNMPLVSEKKQYIQKFILEDKNLPQFDEEIEKISYIDGCKVYFTNSDFVICRFSGTEPILRIFSESKSTEKAQKYIENFKNFVNKI